jgi:DNA-binding transcriptional ArsR family regulator
LKAEFFKTLGHPGRVRALELLSGAEMSVGELQAQIGMEASHLSQQLAVLRRAGLVTTRKSGNSVFYSISSPEIAELLIVARRFLSVRLNEQVDMLRDLEADAGSFQPIVTAPQG